MTPFANNASPSKLSLTTACYVAIFYLFCVIVKIKLNIIVDDFPFKVIATCIYCTTSLRHIFPGLILKSRKS